MHIHSLLALALAVLQGAQDPIHRISFATPNTPATCDFRPTRTGPLGIRPSLWQSDVIHHKIANRGEPVNPDAWADGVERLHGPAALRLKPTGSCRASIVIVYAKTPDAIDPVRLQGLSAVEYAGCRDPEDRERVLKRNAALPLPAGVAVVIALLPNDYSDGSYQSTITHVWDREVRKVIAMNSAIECISTHPDMPPPPPLPSADRLPIR